MKRRILAILLVVSMVSSGTNCVRAENIGAERVAENVEELAEESSLETKDDENKQKEENQTEENELEENEQTENKRMEEGQKEENQNEENAEEKSQTEEQAGENNRSDLKEEEETDLDFHKDENNMETDDENAVNEPVMQKSMAQEEQRIDSSQEETPRNAQSENDTFTEGLVTYQVNEDQTTCTIVEADRTRTDAIVIPEKVRGYKVTVVGKMAFDGCKFKTIQLPDGLLKIEYSAFQNSELENISIPDTVTEIGVNAFLECSNLVSIKLSAGLKKISSGMFRYDEKLQNVKIPDGAEKIESSVFIECSGLVEFSLPDSIKEIGDYAFLKCVNLKKIKLPKYLEKINNETFMYCEKLENVIWPDELKTIEENAFSFCHSLNVQIPDGIQTIQNQGFMEAGMVNVVIPDSVTEFGQRVFQNCKQLQTVKMGAQIERVESDTFNGCDELEIAILSDKTEIIESSAFSSCRALKKIFIPKSVQKIESYALWNAEYVYYGGNEEDWEKIEIGEGNDNIKLLYNQDHLELPNDEKEWDYEVNEDGKTCTLYGRGLKASAALYENLVIDTVDGYTVTMIGEDAFSEDEKIKSVTLSKNIKYVGSGAFGGCKNLRTVTLLSKNTVFDRDSFNMGIGRNIENIYYAGSLSDRKKYYSNDLRVLGDNSEATWHYESNDNVSFQYEYEVNEDGKTCTITKADPMVYGRIEIPEKISGYTVTEIGERAFDGCYSIEQLVLPNSIKKIEKFAFWECYGLEKNYFF